MRFAAIDFETATGRRDSACSVGLAVVEDGRVQGTGHWLIRPPGNEYAAFNVDLHGVTPEMTSAAPLFPDVISEVLDLVGDRPLLAHNASFDMSVLRNACETYAIDCPEGTEYYCSLYMSRAHWPHLPSHSLPFVAYACGLEFHHHSAEEDALTAARAVLRISDDRGYSDLRGLAKQLDVYPGTLFSNGHYYRCSSAVSRPRREKPVKVDVDLSACDPEHPFFDADVAFTGAMASMTRDEAMARVAECGGRGRTAVSRLTEYLVVGSIDYRAFTQGSPSRKLKTAIELQANGMPLQIISEEQFLETL